MENRYRVMEVRASENFESADVTGQLVFQHLPVIQR